MLFVLQREAARASKGPVWPSPHCSQPLSEGGCRYEAADEVVIVVVRIMLDSVVFWVVASLSCDAMIILLLKVEADVAPLGRSHDYVVRGAHLRRDAPSTPLP